MMNEKALMEISEQVKILHHAGDQLCALGEAHDFPAMEYNAKRLLAVVEILEINISDLLEPIDPGEQDAAEHS
ncbi:hypothetical protein HYR54_09075 [Candidatus Acetothermia bacterium]|nr:hypothetical protein [Candidatus Acetothermia bacterium]MBI3660760.1 hypothetical protein [Candidatus Acetothermia bacterium]